MQGPDGWGLYLPMVTVEREGALGKAFWRRIVRMSRKSGI